MGRLGNLIRNAFRNKGITCVLNHSFAINSCPCACRLDTLGRVRDRHWGTIWCQLRSLLLTGAITSAHEWFLLRLKNVFSNQRICVAFNYSWQYNKRVAINYCVLYICMYSRSQTYANIFAPAISRLELLSRSKTKSDDLQRRTILGGERSFVHLVRLNL